MTPTPEELLTAIVDEAQEVLSIDGSGRCILKDIIGRRFQPVVTELLQLRAQNAHLRGLVAEGITVVEQTNDLAQKAVKVALDSEGAVRLAQHLLNRAKEETARCGGDEWCDEVLAKAAELGVGNVRRVVYDPAKHGDVNDVESGGSIWFWGTESSAAETS